MEEILDGKLMEEILDGKLMIGSSARSLTENGIQFERIKFSPVAATSTDYYYGKVRRVLNRLFFTGDKSLDFETIGIH